MEKRSTEVIIKEEAILPEIKVEQCEESDEEGCTNTYSNIVQQPVFESVYIKQEYIHQDLIKEEGTSSNYDNSPSGCSSNNDEVVNISRTEEIDKLRPKESKLNNETDLTNLLTCDFCKRQFSEDSQYQYHMRVHLPFECKLCHNKFIQVSYLKRHMLIHTREKPFECRICKKRFSRSGNLNRHKLIHTREKPFECSVCYNKFSHLSFLKNHMRIHTAVKYECSICHDSFPQTELTNFTGNEPFVCLSCHNKFLQSGPLKTYEKSCRRKQSSV